MPQFKPAAKETVREYFDNESPAYVSEVCDSSNSVTILTGRTDLHPVGKIFQKFGWVTEYVNEDEDSVFITFTPATEVQDAE